MHYSNLRTLDKICCSCPCIAAGAACYKTRQEVRFEALSRVQ